MEEAQGRSTRGKAVVKRGVVHSPYLLMERHREMEAEAAKEVAAKKARREEREKRKEDQQRLSADKAEARERRRCRVCVGPVYRGGKRWIGCICGAFCVCPSCSKSLAAGLALGEHLKVCKGAVGSGSDSDSQSAGEGSGGEGSE